VLLINPLVLRFMLVEGLSLYTMLVILTPHVHISEMFITVDTGHINPFIL